MKNDSGTAISKPTDSVLKLIFALVIACLSWQVQAERYLFHKSGEMVFDSITKLVWMRCSLGQKWDGRTCSGTAKTFTFDAALQAANAINTGGGFNGHTDWALPNIEDLQSLRFCSNGFTNVDKGEANRRGWGEVGTQCKNASLQPAVFAAAMPSTPFGWFKSSSRIDSSRAWAVDFRNGAAMSCCGGFMDQDTFVRLARRDPVEGDPVALGFSTEQLTREENAFRQASTDWSYDDLKGATQKFIDFGNMSGSVYSIYKSGAASSFANQKTCNLDAQDVRKFFLSGASEIWNRHGRSDVDEIHSISEENMFWVGDCLNGKANGKGIIVYFYQGMINSSVKIGAVRTIVTVNNGNPTGAVFAYSNARTCFNRCQNNRYAKEIGKLSEGSAGINLAEQDIVKVANQNNQAMGAIVGSVMVKAAEVLKEGASSSSSTGSSGSNVAWTITSEENGGGLAHWYTKKYSGKCTSGRKAGETITIHLLKSGLYQEVYRSVKKSLSESALDACS